MIGPAGGSVRDARVPLPRRRRGPAVGLPRAASLALVLFTAGQVGCAASSAGTPGPRPQPATTQPSKIAFDLAAIAPSGLTGRPGGLVAVDYEFCIADDPTTEAAVRRIDVTARCTRSRGRIGCARGQLLCIGHTHRPGWRAVLEQLAARDDIRRIERHFAE